MKIGAPRPSAALRLIGRKSEPTAAVFCTLAPIGPGKAYSGWKFAGGARKNIPQDCT
jgi:hypothetical protein